MLILESTSTIYVAKEKALFSCAVMSFALEYAKGRFSHDMGLIFSYGLDRETRINDAVPVQTWKEFLQFAILLTSFGGVFILSSQFVRIFKLLQHYVTVIL